MVLNLALCCGAMWRRTEKRNIGAQRQSLTCTTAPKLFLEKNIFLYDFWCAQTCSFWATLDHPCEIWQSLPALYSDVRNKCISMHIYILGPKLLQLNFIKIFLLSIRSWQSAKPFSPIVGVFGIFDRNFAAIVATTGGRNANSLVCLKSLVKKGVNNRNRPRHRNIILVQSMPPRTNSALASECDRQIKKYAQTPCFRTYSRRAFF